MNISNLAIVLFGSVLLLSSTVVATELDGKQLYETWCAGCHRDSPFAPATVLLKARGMGQSAVIEQRSDLSPALIRGVVRQGRAGMPSFRRVEISETELDEVINHLTKRSDTMSE